MNDLWLVIYGIETRGVSFVEYSMTPWPMRDEEHAAAVANSWLSQYPSDIVMLVTDEELKGL